MKGRDKLEDRKGVLLNFLSGVNSKKKRNNFPFALANDRLVGLGLLG